MLRPLPLERYFAVMRKLGFDIDQLLEGTGLNPELIDQPDYLIDQEQYFRLVDNMIALAGDDVPLGLEVGMSAEIKDFGVLGYTALVCRNVRHSMEGYWARYADPLGMMNKVLFSRTRGDALRIEILAVHRDPASYRFLWKRPSVSSSRSEGWSLASARDLRVSPSAMSSLRHFTGTERFLLAR